MVKLLIGCGVKDDDVLLEKDTDVISPTQEDNNADEEIDNEEIILRCYQIINEQFWMNVERHSKLWLLSLSKSKTQHCMLKEFVKGSASACELVNQAFYHVWK